MPALLDAGSPPGTLPPPKNSLRAFVLALTLRRVGATLLMAVLAALIISPIFVTPTLVLVGRFMVIALVLVLLFTAAGVWRQRWVPTSRKCSAMRAAHRASCRSRPAPCSGARCS